MSQWFDQRRKVRSRVRDERRTRVGCHQGVEVGRLEALVVNLIKGSLKLCIVVLDAMITLHVRLWMPVLVHPGFVIIFRCEGCRARG